MVQILPRPPSKFESLLGSINQGLSGLAEGGQALKGALNERQTRQALSERFGDIFSKVRNPDLQRLMLQNEMEKEKQASKAQMDELSLPDYQTVEKRFGKDFADLYKASSTGGKTELLKAGLDALMRGENIQNLFGNDQSSSQQTQSPTERFTDEATVPQMQKGKIPVDFKFPDYTRPPQGFTRKDWAQERKTWGKENSELYEEGRKRIKSLDRDLLGTNKLISLNNTRKVGEGFQRSLINPSTGEFYGLAQLTGKVAPEAQEWIKEIARFGNRAKDAFGSRVTNFDLTQYMKQFPGLLNTNEGRNRILRMMKINYELDHLYESSRQQILQKKGRTGIPPEEVDRLAQEFIKEDSQKLENEFLGLDRENEGFSEQNQDQFDNRKSLEEIFG